MASYNESKSNLILPNVSLITETNGVAYKPSTPSTPTTPSHDYVEIHGIKWATMNLGANSITDTGLYYQWGDTQGYMVSQVGSESGQKYFGRNDYKYFNGDEYTKYNSTDELYQLLPEDDAVTAAWGGNWRMPTVSEIQTLGDYSDIVYTTNYQETGVSGSIFTDFNDNSKTLFFPDCGHIENGSLNDGALYWTKSVGTYSGASFTWSMRLWPNQDYNGWKGYDLISSAFEPYIGCTIRGVLHE